MIATHFKILALSVAMGLSVKVFAFDTEGAWPSGTKTFQLELDSSAAKPALPAAGLSDGSANWNAVAAAALNSWNPHLTRIQLANTTSTEAIGQNNGKNEITFGPDIFGEAFGDRTLAITYAYRVSDIRITEADIVVNTKFAWDSYRGNLKSNPVDLRRVLIHEIGHAIGLQHPDEANQTVSAIMNASVSNVDIQTADDISGAQALYKNAIKVPTITRQPQSQTVTATQSADIYVETDGGAAPPSSPTLSYIWRYTRPGGSSESLGGQSEGRIPLGSVQVADAGQYRVRIATPEGDVDSSTATLRVNPVTTSANTYLFNLATRGRVENGDNALIVGFTIKTASTRRVLIRGIGPGLAKVGIASGFAPDPRLEVFRSSDNSLVTTNDSWSSAPGVNSALFASAGAFAIDANSKDCAVVLDLPAGGYTAVIKPSGSSAAGIGIVEVYDISPISSPTERLTNLATKGYVGTGADGMAGGLIIRGSQPRTYLIRTAGDSLSSVSSSITGTLDDPVQRLYSGSTVIRYADDWDSPASYQDTLRTAMASVGAFELTDRQESVMLVTLKPGTYTIESTGFAGGKGIAILEVYEMPE